MRIIHLLKTAIKALRAHTSRSILTVLGIVIGITAIILIMSIGKGAEDLILSQIRGMGSALIDVNPGREPKGLSGMTEIFTNSLTEKDFEALKNPSNVQGIKRISPNVAINATVTYGTESKRTLMFGGTDALFDIFEIDLEEGSFFTDDHVKQKAAVIVLGSKVKEKLFSDSDAISKKVRIKNKTFKVIGVTKRKGQASIFDFDDMAVMPYTTAQKYLLGINYFHSISIQAESEEIVERVKRDVELTLREQHNISDPEKDDFHVNTQADAMETVGLIMTILTVLLSAVAAISLVVGGIGIMNIMLVSVTERTREIGLRKALGATDRDILSQFVLEAIILTGIGGLIGIILGSLFSFISSMILSRVVALGWVFTISLNSIVLGISVSAFVGILFGFYPAYQASKKSPIEALRYE